MDVSSHVLDRLKIIVGPKGFNEDADDIAPHLVEWRGRYRGRTPLLLKPETTEQVSRILSICHETRTAVVPQGGNTGLVGGQIPLAGEILLSLVRMNRIRSIDADGMSAIAEAGVVLADLHRAAEDAGLSFPLSLAAEGSATIGGNLSTNAGGTNVLRYGSARHLALGLEVVLADGRVLDLLRALHKDNTGYDLKQLFIGAEGTLGVITAAALRLFPAPATRATGLIAVPDPTAAIALLRELQSACGGLLSAFELIPRMGIELVLAHLPDANDPLRTSSPWYVLAESSGGVGLPLAEIFENTLAIAISSGIATDATIAANEAQRAAIWRLRENLSEAQKREGASLKHDVSVPIRAIPDFLAQAAATVSQLVPGARPVAFGHAGDGNIHFNVSVPKDGDGAAFLARRDELARSIHDLVHVLEGSVSAEHGLGIAKRDEGARYKSDNELELMRTLKRTLDPNNVLNPGKLVAL